MGISDLLDTHILLWWLFNDPFDRMLMAQAELENLPIITYDEAFQTELIQVIPSVK